MTKFCCPKCGHEAEFSVEASVPKETKVSIRLVPKPGERMSAKTVGGVLEGFYRLQAAFGKEAGVKCTTLVDRIETDADGAMRFDFWVMNLSAPEPRKR